MRRLRAAASRWPHSEAARYAGILCLVTAVVAYSGVLERLDSVVYDAGMRLRKARAPANIVIVAIDDISLRQLGQWPWSRGVHAEMVERLTRFGARGIGFDVMFAEPADTDGGDQRLAGAIAANGTVTLPVFPDQNAGGAIEEILPLPVLAKVAAKLGHVDVELDRDSIARSAYLKAGLGSPVWPSLPLAMLERDDAGAWLDLPGKRSSPDIVAHADRWQRDYRIMLEFNSASARFRQVSFVDLLRDDAVANGIRGKFVLIGATANGLARALATPVSGESRPMSGVEFNATVLDNLYRGRWVTPLEGWSYAALLSLFALLPAFIYRSCKPRYGVLAAFALAPLTLAFALALLYFARLWFAPAPALIAVLISYPLWSWRRIEASARTLRQERERARATLNAIGDAVVATDTDGVITYLNPVAEKLSESSRREAVGRHISSVFWSPQAPEREKIMAVIRQALSEGRPVRSPSYASFTRPFGDPLIVRITASPLPDSEGRQVGAVVAIHDMTETVSLTRQVNYQSTHDTLTGLPNRELLADRVSQAIATARRDDGIVAVMFLDLDDFKYINSSLGHGMGDELLVEVAARLEQVGRADDTIARWDGDQFAILVTRLTQPEIAGMLARKFIEANAEPYLINEREIHVSSSIGISLFPQDADDAESLFKHADVALHRIKHRGHNAIGYYDEDYNKQSQQRIDLEASLRQALRLEQFELHYQPQIALSSGAVTGVEALLRWRHPERGLLLPGDYILVAEETSLIHQIGDWVLLEACRQASRWRRAGQPLNVGINVSARQLENGSLTAGVKTALAQSGALASDITLEITESALMHEPARARQVLDELKALGITISLDDFGTGYASLANLKNLPVDQVKIDQSFVRDLVSDPGDAAIIQAVIGMAHSMGLSVVAEGVETADQLAFLRRHDCNELQGFLFSPALDVTALAQWLAEGAGRVDLYAAEVANAAEAMPTVRHPKRLH